MAIVIEEKKNRVDLIQLFGWIVVIGVVVVAVYYIFFAAPEIVNISAPSGLGQITPIAEISLHPDDVLASPVFQSLRQPSFPLPTPQGPAAVGRTNPFVSF